MKRSLVVAAVAATFSVLSARAQSPDASVMTSHEIALLKFYGGGSPLTDVERQQAAGIVQEGLRRDTRAAVAADVRAANMLDTLAKASVSRIAWLRETGRYNAAFHQVVSPDLRGPQEAEARIIEAHDPTILVDAAHRHLITRQMLRSLWEGDIAGARLFDVPVGNEALDELGQALRASYPTMDEGLKDALAHAERDMPYAAPYLQQALPKRRAALVAEYRQKILAASDPADRQLHLAEVMAVVGAVAFRHQAAQGYQGAFGERLLSQRLQQNQLLGSARSFSPSCNVATGAATANFGYCHPAP